MMKVHPVGDGELKEINRCGGGKKKEPIRQLVIYFASSPHGFLNKGGVAEWSLQST